MRITRSALALACVAAFAAALPASAVAKPTKASCKLIVDETKDTFLLRNQEVPGVYGPQEDGFDIVSGDVASNAKTLTGVLRVAKLATAPQSAPGGLDFRVQFLVGAQDPAAENFFLNARVDRSGTATYLLGLKTLLPLGVQSTTAKLADATGTFDLKRNEVRIHVPLAAVKSGTVALKPGTKVFLGGLDQTASRQVAVNPATGVGTATFADVAQSDKTYVAGSRSCVVPGR